MRQDIDKVRKLRTGQREAAILAMERSKFDVREIRERIESFERSSRSLRLLSAAMFVATFVLFPLALRFVRFESGVLGFLITLLLTAWTAACGYHRVTTLVDPHIGRLQRWTGILHIVLYPLSAMRCADTLSLKLLQGYDVAAVSFVLGGFALAGHAVRKSWAMVPVPGMDLEDMEAVAALIEYRTLHLDALRKFLTGIGSSLEATLGPPAPQSADCRSYCPRCFAQYQLEDGPCSDCAGVRLRRFEVSIPESEDPL